MLKLYGIGLSLLQTLYCSFGGIEKCGLFSEASDKIFFTYLFIIKYANYTSSNMLYVVILKQSLRTYEEHL